MLLRHRSQSCALILGLALLATPSLAHAQDTETLGALQDSIQKAADKVSKSVVLIYCEREKGSERGITPLEQRRLGLFMGGQTSKGYFDRPKGPTTGVIVNDDGGILTAGFNVSGKIKKIWVVGHDGKKRPAKLLGKDPNLDVHMLKVEDAKGLKAPSMANSKKITPGQFAILVSRSERTKSANITFGIISAVGRKRGKCFQLSARMNYGNAGGAIVNLDGQLIGVASHLNNRSVAGQNSGVGFAAPVHELKTSLKTMATGKDVPKIRNPFLGIQGNPQTTQGQKGVRIMRVLEGTAAAKAKLKAGDVIKIFNGVEINDFMTLVDEIQKLSVGDKIIVTVARDGWEKDFTIVLGARPENQ